MALSLTRARSTMSSWIQDAISDVDKVDESGKIRSCTALVLMHVQERGEEEVHSVQLAHSQKSIQDLERMFRYKADERAQNLPGTQKFHLVAYYAGTTEPGARMIFCVEPLQNGEAGYLTEGPSPTGQIQQGMRHADMVFMQLFRQQQATNELLLSFAERQSTHIERLENENREAFFLVKKVAMDRDLDRYERDKELLKMERNTRLLELGVRHAPSLVNILFGRDVFSQAGTDTALVESVAEALTPDAVSRIVESLQGAPHVVALFLSRLEQYHRQKSATMQAIENPTPRAAPVDGEADAGGGK